MSLITCCPACQTMFRVVPDQLRISEGWVRCGHCSEVFDAAAHLQDRASGSDAPVPAGEDTTPGFVRDLSGAPLPSPPDRGYPPFVLPRQEPELAAAPAATPAPMPAAAPAAPVPAAAAVAPAAAEGPQTEPPPTDLSEVSFVREARRAAYWRQPGPRALLVVLALALSALLAGQFGLQERDRIAAMFPQVRPVLERLCEPLACTVGAPRQIDAIVIDSSSFSRLRGDAYRLGFVLKNQAAFDVAMPAIELTLTDTQDQPVLRRVLRAADFAPGTAAIAAAADQSANLAIAVAAGGGSARIAGYRLLAFYP